MLGDISEVGVFEFATTRYIKFHFLAAGTRLDMFGVHLDVEVKLKFIFEFGPESVLLLKFKVYFFEVLTLVNFFVIIISWN